MKGMGNKAIYNCLLICILLGFSGNQVLAQTNYISDDQFNMIHQQAEELFLNEKYAAAIEKFEEIIERTESITDRENIDAYVNAKFKIAVSSYYLEQKSATELLNKFTKNYETHPLSDEANLYLGRYYFNDRKHKKTITYLSKIKGNRLAKGDYIEWQFMLGYANFFKKQFKIARTYFEQIEKEPSDYYFSSNYYLGYMSYYEKNYDKALSHFFIVNSSNMYGDIVPYYIAQIYFIQKEYERVIEFAQPLLENPELKYFESTENILGQSYFQLKQYNEALPFQKKFVENSQKVLKSDVYNLAYSYYQLEDYEPALYELLKLTDSKDSLAQNANFLLGDCFLKLKDKQSARNAFKKAYMLDFDALLKEEAAFNYAKLTYELQFQGEAIQSIQEFIAEFPQSKHILEANEILTSLFLETKNYGAAIVVIENMNKQSPLIKKAYQKVCFYRGVELYNGEQLMDATEYFTKCINNPYDKKFIAKALFWKGEAQYQAEQYQEARESFNQFIEVSNGIEGLAIEERKSFALYNIAYSYYNSDNYKRALTYFENTIKALDKEKEEIERTRAFKKSYPDAYLRNADCHFILKNYNNAIKSYQLIIESDLRGKDYALFQQGVIYGLIEPANHQKKIENLQVIMADYPWSIYIDDATYELGDTYYALQNNDSAMHYFNAVVDNFPGSSYGRKALLKMALMHFNVDAHDEAESKCFLLLKEYPNSQEAKEAIDILKEIYISKGSAAEFFALLREEFPQINITLNEQDSISYYAAETQYVNENYDAALELFNSYLNDFENGFFMLNAHFYRGQCLYRNKSFNKALQDYEYVLGFANNKFTETALHNAAYIYDYIVKDPSEAAGAYEKLVTISEFQDHQLKALGGLVRNFYTLKFYAKVLQYSEQTINHEHANQDHILLAELYKGKALLALDSINLAKASFDTVATKSQAENGVDARYHLALISYKEELYDTSLNQCFYIINNMPNYEYWMAKTFILLADNYYKLDNEFQAKATLQSIIDYYEGDDLVAIAQAKLDSMNIIKDTTMAEVVDSIPVQTDSTMVEDTLQIQTDLEVDQAVIEQLFFDTLVLDGDTILLEIDQPKTIESDTIQEDTTLSIPQDSINTIDTIESQKIDLTTADSSALEMQDSTLMNEIDASENIDSLIQPETIMEDSINVNESDSIQTLNVEATIDSLDLEVKDTIKTETIEEVKDSTTSIDSTDNNFIEDVIDSASESSMDTTETPLVTNDEESIDSISETVQDSSSIINVNDSIQTPSIQEEMNEEDASKIDSTINSIDSTELENIEAPPILSAPDDTSIIMEDNEEELKDKIKIETDSTQTIDSLNNNQDNE